MPRKSKAAAGEEGPPDAEQIAQMAASVDWEDVVWLCLRCGEDIPQDLLSSPALQTLPSGVRRLQSGVLALVDEQGYYCARCAPGVRTCRRCGCTDEVACDDGCCWMGADLCSNCVEWENRVVPARGEGPIHVG